MEKNKKIALRQYAPVLRPRISPRPSVYNLTRMRRNRYIFLMNAFFEKANSINKRRIILVVWPLSRLPLSFIPVAKNKFLNWDDNVYVSENPHIKNINAENIAAWFSHSYAGTYLPFTMASYAIDYRIGGLALEVFIFTNLLFHLLNAILVFLLVFQLVNLTRTEMKYARNGITSLLSAALVSILFAVHPCNVESVAWVAERKNVLSAFFSCYRSWPTLNMSTGTNPHTLLFRCFCSCVHCFQKARQWPWLCYLR